MRPMKNTVLILMILPLAGYFLALIPSTLGVFELEERHIFLIDVYVNGSATWTFRRVFILRTEDDITLFEQYLTVFQSSKEYILDEFINQTRVAVARASDYAGRPMEATNFNVSAYILTASTSPQGVIEYTFLWIGFALVEKNEIKIGDVFEIGIVLLDGDELDIRYPDGYVTKGKIEPQPTYIKTEDRLLIWTGPLTFVSRTPSLTLMPEGTSPNNILLSYWPIIVSTVTITCSVLVFLKFKVTKIHRKQKLPYEILQENNKEKKIIDLLKASGGYMQQSEITTKLGLSKSKVSETLSSMEKKGLIKRLKKGREKIVILTLQESDKGEYRKKGR